MKLLSSPVYLRDLDKDKQSEVFLGKGLDKLKKIADKKNCEIIVGYYLDKPMLED